MANETDNRRKILLIDDDLIQYKCLRELIGLFRGELFTLEWAPNFGEGLLALLSGKYCACLLDYQLGDRTGLELLQQAKTANCHTPVILITGMADGDIDMDASNAGAVDYLVKSEVNPRSLERAVRYALKISESMDALRLAATHDEVSGLLNRRAFDSLLEEEVMRASRFSREFSLTIVDLDHFKSVNDRFGHQVGDHVLRHVGKVLASQLRGVDRIARYGGEEFAIVHIETDSSGAYAAADRLRALLESSPFISEEKQLVIPITLSAGVAVFPRHGRTFTELIEAADQALYAAKAQGRNRVVAAVKPAAGSINESTASR